LPPPVLSGVVRMLGNPRSVEWAFNHYLTIAHPSFARSERPVTEARQALVRAA
jgi:hypothetical protein